METMYPFYIGVVKLDSKIGNMFTMDLTKSDPHSLLAEVDFSLKVFLIYLFLRIESQFQVIKSTPYNDKRRLGCCIHRTFN